MGRLRNASCFSTFLLFLLISLWALPGNIQAQKSDSVVVLSVHLFDESNHNPIAFAHIVNLRNMHGGISDTTGYFRLPAKLGDMLRMSSIGYFDQYFVVSDTLSGYVILDILMKQKVYLIQEVRINTLGNYDQFKRKFVETELPGKEARKIQKYFREMARDTGMKYTPLKTGIRLNFPSPEQRLEIERQELYNKLREQRKMDAKFSPPIVSKMTGLKGDELYEFMRFCNFSRDYLLNTNDYDILIETLFKYDQFVRFKKLQQLDISPNLRK